MASGPVFEPRLRELAGRRETKRAIELDQWVLPAAADREGYYAGRDFEYWLSGLYDYLSVRQRLPDFDTSEARLLDFGGATARVSRHFAAQDGTSVTVSDINANHVEWVREHFAGRISALAHSHLPPLPVADGEFDVVLAFSVFTHIDEQESAWLDELRRILRRGGLLYLTVHDESTWQVLPSSSVYSALQRSPEFNGFYRSSPTLEDRVAFHYDDRPAYNCNVFHPTDYIRREWGRTWELAAFAPLEHCYQTGVVLRRR